MRDALDELRVAPWDAVAIAVSDQLSRDAAAHAASVIGKRLDELGAPAAQRTWIIATLGDDRRTASVIAAIADHAQGATLLVHDPRDLDGLTFERRLPGQRRGGVYLNAVWQAASVKIGCGQPLPLVEGLSAWFNRRETLRTEDLGETLLIPPLGLEA